MVNSTIVKAAQATTYCCLILIIIYHRLPTLWKYEDLESVRLFKNRLQKSLFDSYS